MTHDPTREREALRQQMLLRALWRDARPGVVAGWMRDDPARFQRGLQAYQANASALAERALAATYPVLRQLIGEESFATLARVFWHRQPPLRGDMGLWGDGLPDFVADSESLAEEPYLADVARLEWRLHEATRAADPDRKGLDLEALGRHDPALIRLQLAPGLALIDSPHPIVSIWRAHPPEPVDDPGDERFAPVREAFAAGRGECALVWRAGYRPELDALAAPDAAFISALLSRQPLAAALEAAGAGFGFEAWLIRALQQGWIENLHVGERSAQ